MKTTFKYVFNFFFKKIKLKIYFLNFSKLKYI